MAEVTPVTLVIGLPGAGKTTLLRHLARPDIAVVAAQPDPPMWWNAGCACCAPRDDVARALRTLLPRVRRDEVRRVVIETSGRADPGPILATLLSDTVAASAYRLDAIVAVVDTVNGLAALDRLAAPDRPTALDRGDKALRQVALADRIVLTHTALADATALRARVRRLNPGAIVAVASHETIDPAAILGAGLCGTPEDARAWLNAKAFDAAESTDDPRAAADCGPRASANCDPRASANCDPRASANCDPRASANCDPRASANCDPRASARCDTTVNTFCLTFERRLPWPDVKAWLERLILTHGNAVLRMKGILYLQDNDDPVAIHSAGHLLHPPVALAGWPQGDRPASRLVFITRDLPRAAVEPTWRDDSR
jgi:G3E family GTPase